MNKIFDSLQKKTVEKVQNGQLANTAYFWAWDEHKIVREKYYGKKMNGNQCDKLLDHADELAQLLPIDLKMYGLALMRFRDFKHACFSTQLDPNWKKKMQDFESIYNKLGIGNFPKLHACVQHVAEWIEFSGKPLGLASEQTFEGKCLYKKLLERDCYFLKNNTSNSHLQLSIVTLQKLGTSTSETWAMRSTKRNFWTPSLRIIAIMCRCLKGL